MSQYIRKFENAFGHVEAIKAQYQSDSLHPLNRYHVTWNVSGHQGARLVIGFREMLDYYKAAKRDLLSIATPDEPGDMPNPLIEAAEYSPQVEHGKGD